MAITVATPPGEPARPELAPHVEELLRALAAFQTALQRLSDLAGEKLAAMRRADADALQSCTTLEHRMLADVAEARRRREAALARLARSLRWPAAATATLAEICQRLPEPFCSALRARNGALRETAASLQRKNKLAASVARNLHAHVRSIFAELAKASQESAVYGPSGQHDQAGKHAWVDAIG